MRNSQYFRSGNSAGGRVASFGAAIPKKALVGVVLIIALISFEIFNFDTTQYALHSLLGDIRFLGVQWAAILAIAFCSIDFAGLIRIFTPERGENEPKEVWYLTGAWLLGATMNAIMTWWAVSLALLNHSFGNEVLSREQLLLYVPIFVAVLVWLTRILFIGAFSVAGEHLFDIHSIGKSSQPRQHATKQTRPTSKSIPQTTAARPRARRAAPKPKPRTTAPTTGYIEELQYEPIAAQPVRQQPPQPQPQPTPPSMPKPRTEPMSRVKQRPPRPMNSRVTGVSGYQAQPRNKQ